MFAGNNKIQFLNGNAFQGLVKLKRVLLKNNTCINVDFKSLMRMEKLQQTVNRKCRFLEPISVLIIIVSSCVSILIFIIAVSILFWKFCFDGDEADLPASNLPPADSPPADIPIPISSNSTQLSVIDIIEEAVIPPKLQVIATIQSHSN
jgi:hypothetical protein